MSLEDPRSAMEGRARRRAKAVRVEPEPPTTTRRHEPGTRAAVVYYLTRNHHLEHPHFMEVTLASPQGLYLRDVTGRLDALRGKGMAAKYSWSCKRSYKTGFVWHDLSADDLLLPTQGTEFVLKGSELPFDLSKPLPLPDRQQSNAECASNAKVQPCKPARQQESPRSPGSSNQGWTSKSPSPTPATYPAVPVMKEAVPPSPPPPPPTRAAVVPAMKETAVPPPPPQPALLSSPTASTVGDEEQCRLPPHSGSSSNSSPKTSMASSSGASSPGPTKPAAAGSDAATQTDDKARWDDVKLQCRQGSARASSSPERPEMVVDEESRCMLAPAGENHPRSRRSGTLQSLIRAEAAGRRRALPLPEEEDDRAAAAAAATGGSVSGRLKPANLLMRLMACGPNHPGFGLVQGSSSYRPPRFAQLEYPSSPELSPLSAVKPGTTGASTVRASETENCSGRLLDGALKPSSSSSSRSHHEGVVCGEEAWPEGVNNNLSRSASKRTSDPSSGRTASSSKVVSFRDE